MARIRTIKPEFFRHLGLYEAEIEEQLPLRVAFAGLWTSADREGLFVWCPKTLKLDCLPHDQVDFSRVLDALWTRGFIGKYASEHKVLGFIPSWKTHQHINNRENASVLPKPSPENILTREARVDDATVTRHEGKGKEGKGKELYIRRVTDASEPDVPLNGSPPQKRFVKPTLDEVRAYCDERRNRVDPQTFLDHYESNGWRVGKNPMKDWKAAVRTWERPL